MSYQLVTEVRDMLRVTTPTALDPTERFVLVLIAEAARNHSRQASISMAELGDVTGTSRSTVSRAVRTLAANGWIKVISYGNRSRDGRSHASVYELLPMDACSAGDTC